MRGVRKLEKRKAMMTAVITLMVLSIVGVTAYYWYMQAHYVESDDARVDGNITNISPQITSKITAIYVAEGDNLRVGDIIARQLDLGLGQGANIDLTVMKSPINGTVINKIGNVGEVGSPGQPLS
jgi:multidrug resistance efflux pump